MKSPLVNIKARKEYIIKCQIDSKYQKKMSAHHKDVLTKIAAEIIQQL